MSYVIHCTKRLLEPRKARSKIGKKAPKKQPRLQTQNDKSLDIYRGVVWLWCARCSTFGEYRISVRELDDKFKGLRVQRTIDDVSHQKHFVFLIPRLVGRTTKWCSGNQTIELLSNQNSTVSQELAKAECRFWSKGIQRLNSPGRVMTMKFRSVL
jgi:hypothetical protein